MAKLLTWLGYKLQPMNQYEAPALIAQKFPEAAADIAFLCVTGDIYKIIDFFSQFTKELIVTRQHQLVSQCMLLADKIYKLGDTIVKNAIENVFVYSFSVMRNCCSKDEWRSVQSKMPPTLYILYTKQMMQPGC